MTREEALAYLRSQIDLAQGEFYVGVAEMEASDTRFCEALAALGVTEEEMP